MAMSQTVTESVTEGLSAPLNIRSNSGPYVPGQWLKPTRKDTPFHEMRKRLREDGYVFVKGLLPREQVIDVRKEYFELHEPTGIIKPGTALEDGIFNDKNDALGHGGIGAGELPPTERQVDAMIQSHTQPKYLEMLENPTLREYIRGIMGWKSEILLERTMIRHNAPGALSTGIHYDKIFLRKGESEFLTAWVPIGDIAPQGGGLMYLSDSVPLGRQIEDDFSARAQVLSNEERLSAFNVHMEKYGQLSQDANEFSNTYPVVDDAQDARTWMGAQYEAGDVVFHDPYIVHCSTKNEGVDGRIRVSTDVRFYEEGSSIDDRWMKLWTPGDGL